MPSSWTHSIDDPSFIARNMEEVINIISQLLPSVWNNIEQDINVKSSSLKLNINPDVRLGFKGNESFNLSKDQKTKDGEKINGLISIKNEDKVEYMRDKYIDPETNKTFKFIKHEVRDGKIVGIYEEITDQSNNNNLSNWFYEKIGKLNPLGSNDEIKVVREKKIINVVLDYIMLNTGKNPLSILNELHSKQFLCFVMVEKTPSFSNVSNSFTFKFECWVSDGDANGNLRVIYYLEDDEKIKSYGVGHTKGEAKLNAAKSMLNTLAKKVLFN